VTARVAALAACVLALAAPDARAAGTYVALGDSVSRGSGAPAGSGFVDLYFQHLQLDRLANLARGGETAAGMLAARGPLEQAVTVIDGDDDVAVVTLGIGGNDARHDCRGGVAVPPCTFLTDYPAIVGALAAALARDPGDEVFQVMQYYNPYVGTVFEDAAAAVLLGEDRRVDCAAAGAAVGFNDAIACLGQAAGATSVDPYRTFALGGRALLFDDVHPNALGHAYLACLFARPERAGSANPCAVPPPVPAADPPTAPTTPATPPPAAPAPADRRAPALLLRRDAGARLLARGGLVLSLRSDEDATATASGVLTAAGRRIALGGAAVDLRAGVARRVRLRLAARHRPLVRRTLRGGRRISARVRVRATDRAGNASRARLSLRRVP
jgi:lysophospholipase L1-like esterase